MAKVTEEVRKGGGKRVKFEKDAAPAPGDDAVDVVESKGKNGGKHIRFKRRSEK